MAAEDEEIEVELTRAPALAVTAAERALEPLQPDEEGKRAGGWIGSGRDVDRHGGVAELRLVDHPDRLCRIEPGDAAQPRARQRGEGMDAGGDRCRGVPEVRPESDVCTNPPDQCPPPAR